MASSQAKFKITIGLDRDGTINEDRGYIGHPDAFVPIDKSLEAVAQIRAKGYNIVVLTNQAGISKGLMTPDDVDQVNQRMLEMLGEAGCPSIDGIYYSTTSMKQDIYAKPNVGMFQRAEKETGVRFKGGAFVGDKMSDLKAAMKMGATPVLVRTGHGIETEQDLNKYAYREIKKKVAIFDNLWAFASALPYNEE
jgi:D-glycero-D-manno-heptose 1,7-bisphosphate phosphatase